MKTKIILPAFFLVILLSSFSLLRIRFSPASQIPVSALEAKVFPPATGLRGGDDEKIYFTCLACGCPEDDSFFTKPGLCPSCGMAYVATYKNLKKSSQSNGLPTEGKKVAVLVFDGVQTIDYSGPVEVFSAAGMRIFAVSQKTDPVRTSAGIRIVPDYTFENCPKADIILLPGGDVNDNRARPEVQAWIKKNVASSDRTLSVCNGAFYLASAGLLDHQKATTFNGLIPDLRKEVPSATIVTDERFVDNGKIITAAGLASGIDGALYVVQEYLGIGTTQEIATHLEYNWDPNGSYVRAALADNQLCNGMSVVEQFDHETIVYSGDREQWKAKYLVRSDLPKEKLVALFDTQLQQSSHWTKIENSTADGTWKFKSDDGRQWTSWITVDGKPNAWNVTIDVKQG